MFDELNCNQCSPTINDVSSASLVSSSSLLEVHLVHKGDIFYAKGRKLAENVYRQIWGTENLIDGNDYGIVVSHDGKVLGNMNIQLRKPEKLLKSESFFCREHWQQYFSATNTNIAEASALAIDRDTPTNLRRPIMMMLMTGLQTFCRLEGIKYLVTIQHDYLIRILTKSLHLPFFPNQMVKKPQAEIPQDSYWQREKLPSIYYSEPLGAGFTDACSSFFFYLSMSGIQTAFYPRVKKNNKLHFSTFRKNWEQGKAEARNIFKTSYSAT